MTITKALAKIGYARVKSIYSYLEIALCKAWVLTLKKKLKPSITDLEIVKASITDRGYGSRNLK